MNSRLQSAIATVLINGALLYGLYAGIAVSIRRQAAEKMILVKNVPPPKLPPLPRIAPPPAPTTYIAHPDAIGWATATPELRNLAFISIFKWIKDNTVTEEDKRFARWRDTVPQGSGPGRVTRLRPPNLTTHTLYWPAKWSRGLLPIIAWGNGFQGQCNNSSLSYAAFLSEIASHGYFVVAVGNDDIEYPQPEGLEILADGRPVHTQPSTLTKAVDWAIAENTRAGSPYFGKLDTGRIAYMGQGCGGGQAMTASSDPRTTTTVLLNSAARFSTRASDAKKESVAYFEGGAEHGSVLDEADDNFARAEAANWPVYKAALDGMSYAGAYPGPDKRWSKAVLAWLDWQLKGDSKTATALKGLSRDGWSHIGSSGL